MRRRLSRSPHERLADVINVVVHEHVPVDPTVIEDVVDRDLAALRDAIKNRRLEIE